MAIHTTFPTLISCPKMFARHYNANMIGHIYACSACHQCVYMYVYIYIYTVCIYCWIGTNLANLRVSSIALSNVNRKLKTTFQPSIRARLSKAIFSTKRGDSPRRAYAESGGGSCSYPYSPQVIKLNTFVCLWPIRNHAQAHLNMHTQTHAHYRFRFFFYMHKQQLLSHTPSLLYAHGTVSENECHF